LILHNLSLRFEREREREGLFEKIGESLTVITVMRKYFSIIIIIFFLKVILGIWAVGMGPLFFLKIKISSFRIFRFEKLNCRFGRLRDENLYYGKS
jgi:hypothetical protein